MANTSIDLVGLDFNTIKTNLKTYLKNNTSFKDLDFEASNINVLLDVLSYNTYLNSFYTNMVASEMFIDTAQLRDSIVSHAKSLNYTPRSFVSAIADISLSITPSTSVSNVLIPKGTTFTSRVGSNTFSFSTDQNLVLNTSNNGTFSSNLSIYEGSYLTDSFVMNYSNTTQRFVLSNPTVDTSSISVTVIEDNGDTSLFYNKTDTLINLNSLSRIYFIEAAENQQYELRFGDNIFGRKPKDGSVIVAEYRTSSGELPNGASSFLNDGSIDGHSNVSITTINNASGGSINETIESIRYNAPRSFQSQGRAVTTSDYENLLVTNFPEIENITAYGGENLVPPQFGKVFISVDVKNADGTPENRIEAYRTFIKDKTPVSIEPIFVNPEFMYIDIVTSVNYNINLTSKLSNDIKTLVQSKISSFNTTYLNGFKKTFYFSKLVSEIDKADTSILSNFTQARAFKTLNPSLNTKQSFYVDFGFTFIQETGIDMTVEEVHYGHTITSSAFTYDGNRSIFVDDTNGKIFIASLTGGLAEIVKEIGTVDYINGIVTINNITISAYEGSGIKIYSKSKLNDITSSKNVILSINDQDVSVLVTPLKV